MSSVTREVLSELSASFRLAQGRLRINVYVGLAALSRADGPVSATNAAWLLYFDWAGFGNALLIRTSIAPPSAA
jgi:hypothetical protein